MKTAIYARRPSQTERQTLIAGMKSTKGVTVRRSQIILMSADQKLKAGQIGDQIGVSDQLVRNVIHGFNEYGTDILKPGSRARHDDQRAFDEQGRERLREIIRQSPRSFGCESSLWTLKLLAEVSEQVGLTDRQVHPTTVGWTLSDMGINWGRAKHWINSPDDQYERKKGAGTG